jgi:hypothetical protein
MGGKLPLSLLSLRERSALGFFCKRIKVLSETKEVGLNLALSELCSQFPARLRLFSKPPRLMFHAARLVTSQPEGYYEGTLNVSFGSILLKSSAFDQTAAGTFIEVV